MGRIALAFAFATAAASACGGASAPAPAPRAQGRPIATVEADAGAEAGGRPALPSYDELALRGASSAPLMRAGRRLASSTGDSGASSTLRDDAGASLRFDRDTCVTVVFAASSSIRLWLEDEARAKRGEPAAGVSGALPPRGPACVKRGEELHVVVEGPADVRAIVFTSP